MAGLTEAGLVAKTRPEIFENIQSKFKTRIDPLWDDRSNNVINIIANIFAEETSDLWGGVQGAYDASYPSSAYDVSLDDVADIVAVKRIAASQSVAVLQVTGTVGAIVPVDSVVTVADTSERFLVSSSLTLTNTRFSDIVLNITSVVDSTVYSLTLNSEVVSINSGVSATANSILTALKAAIDADVSGVTTSLPTSTTLRINVTENNSVFGLVLGSRIGVTSVSDLVQVMASNFGVVKAPANSITNLLVPIAGVTSVINLEAADEGRERETDEELRVRRYESVSIIGASTQNAITANVRNLEAVTAAFIIENDTFATVDGIPAKSFETVVEGGDEQTIAQTIFDYKPVGIKPHGTITRTVVDGDGNSVIVRFSRPVDVFIRVEVDYTTYTEETLPSTAEDAIKTAVITYGNTLNIGKDVIPKRFYGGIYAAVDGLDDVTVRVSKSYDEVTWTPYTEDSISIGVKEASVFDITRVTVAEV